jgi:hypothetical protein
MTDDEVEDVIGAVREVAHELRTAAGASVGAV